MRGIEGKDEHHRISEGKYLKYLYSLHEKQGILNVNIFDNLCSVCSLREKCQAESLKEKGASVYCIEGSLLKKISVSKI